jgi:hypothetical protein
MKKTEAKNFDTLSLLAIWTATNIHKKFTMISVYCVAWRWILGHLEHDRVMNNTLIPPVAGVLDKPYSQLTPLSGGVVQARQST